MGTYTLIHKRAGTCLVMGRAAFEAFAAENDMSEWDVRH